MESDVSLVDLANFLKRMCKILISFDQHNNAAIQQKIIDVIDVAVKTTQRDEEIKAMVPCTFEGLSYMYRSVNGKNKEQGGSVQFLVDLYEHKLGPFMRREIGEGRPDVTPVVKDDKADKDKKADGAENFEQEPLDDENFLVNRSIAQNMHFLFGVFV